MVAASVLYARHDPGQRGAPASVVQFAIESNQTMTEIMDQLFAICDALPSVGPSQAIVDCDRIPHMPDITFSLPDADLTLSSEQYVLRVSFAVLPTVAERNAVQDTVTRM